MSGNRHLRLWLVALVLAGCSSGSSLPAGPGAGIPAGATAGLDRRPQNLSCVAPERTAQMQPTISLTRVFAGLAFSQPLGMLQSPGDDSRWFVLEKPGRVRVFPNVDSVSAFDTDFIDLRVSFTVNSSSEAGLLGMAFAPDFATSGDAYLSWTEGSPIVSRIDRFSSLDGGQTLDPGSRASVIRLNQDFDNHNGGHIAFGPDGLLYAGFGDGGSGGDPNGRAQDTTNLLGAMLRISVGATGAYTVPPTNPFAANPLCPPDHSSASSCPELFAWGLRNPWRFSFDRATGELWAGDVGQNAFEEIDRIELGRNYGWDCREAYSAFSGATASCATAANLADPVYAYGRSQGSSVTGGYVYRGSAIPALAGSYVFADFGSGRIWRLVPNGQGQYAAEELLDTALSIASFAESLDGELYVVDLAGGALYRIGPGVAGGGAAPPVASRLSATGCFEPQAPATATAGMIPYRVAASFWSDGADKERWIAVPDAATVGIAVDGSLVWPPGTVLAKHFRLGGELVETRLFMRHPDGGWAGYSYAWDAQQTDATLVVGGGAATIGGQNWLFPDENQCLTCHTPAANFALGTEVAQLNVDMRYAATGRTANQLATLDAIGLFSAPLGSPAALPSLPEPFGSARTLTDRARAYLHTNCAQCHRPGGTTGVAIDLRFAAALTDTGTCDVAPQRGDLGIADARIIAPGRPDQSVLLERLSRRADPAAMPPLASTLPDAAGIGLVRSWIAGLAGC
jgi:uncharacterized repeat protein (TIGR03806 family)